MISLRFLRRLMSALFLFYKEVLKMNVTTEMYTKLFNELTDILNELENIKERIKKVQAETEEIYINNDV